MPTPFGPLSGRKIPAIVPDVNKRERSFISAGRDLCPWLLRLALVASLWNSNSFGRFQVFVVSGGKRSFVVSSTKENWPFARCRLSPVSGLRFSSLFSCFPISTIFLCLRHLFSSCRALSCVSFVCFDRRGDRGDRGTAHRQGPSHSIVSSSVTSLV